MTCVLAHKVYTASGAGTLCTVTIPDRHDGKIAVAPYSGETAATRFVQGTVAVLRRGADLTLINSIADIDALSLWAGDAGDAVIAYTEAVVADRNAPVALKWFR